MNEIAPVITTALSVGFGCGTCCSPVISVFLSSYVVSHSDGAKKGALSFASLFLGKAISVTVLCMISALIGRQFIGVDGYIGWFNLRLVAQIIMSSIGLVLASRWVLDNCTEAATELAATASCGGCGGGCEAKKPPACGLWPTFTAGLTYGFTPCTPLLMMIGYAFTLPIALAGVTGTVFSLASAVSPVLLLAVISGALSKRLAREIPQHLKWFQLGSYVLMMVMPFIISYQ
jgi:hypothetical protein